MLWVVFFLGGGGVVFKTGSVWIHNPKFKCSSQLLVTDFGVSCGLVMHLAVDSVNQEYSNGLKSIVTMEW